MAKRLDTADEVIQALGGPRALMELVDAKATTLCNWRRAQSFPAKHLAVMTAQLAQRGFTAPAALWRQTV